MKMIIYKILLLWSLSDEEEIVGPNFYSKMLEHCEDEERFVGHLFFSDESIVNFSNKIQLFLGKNPEYREF